MTKKLTTGVQAFFADGEMPWRVWDRGLADFEQAYAAALMADP
ncbi:hypothetical protein [Mesorhizobium sp.]|nr:hypothetical protein [Mesorhizobium sp.]